MLQRLSYLFLHDSSLHVFTSPTSHSHSWFQCFVIKFTGSLIKKPMTLLWFWEGWWFSNRNYSVMHLFTSKRQGVLKWEATCCIPGHKEILFKISQCTELTTQSTLLNTKKIPVPYICDQTFEFIWSDMVWKSLFQTSFLFNQESWSLSNRRLLAAQCNLFSFDSVNLCRINWVENYYKGFFWRGGKGIGPHIQGPFEVGCL